MIHAALSMEGSLASCRENTMKSGRCPVRSGPTSNMPLKPGLKQSGDTFKNFNWPIVLMILS